MAQKISNEDIIAINEAYLRIGTYSGVSRELGFSASTVRKYVQKDYVSEKDRVLMHPDLEECRKIIGEFKLSKEQLADPLILTLTAAEKEGIKELWKELAV